MKILVFPGFALLSCIACTIPKTEVAAVQDSASAKMDTMVQQTNATEVSPPTSSDTIETIGELTEEKGETIYVVQNQYSFISDPYDFSLDVATIEALLGEEAKTKVEEFEAGEDYDAYSYFTISWKDTEISFYDYPGKHFSHITSPLLPLKNGIKIGMTKDDFLKTMTFSHENALKTSLYRLTDDYGYMDFKFRADTLSLISAHYEEGD
jgi:hypothetical protein